MNSLSHFSSAQSDSARFDSYEGLDGHFQPADIVKLAVRNKHGEQVLEPASPFKYSAGITPNLNVFCTCLVEAPVSGELVDMENACFGDGFVLLLDTEEFFERLRKEVERVGHFIDHNVVNYVDVSSYSGEWGAYRKPDQLSFQSEYRFVVSPGIGKPLVLRLGSLEEIVSPIAPLEEINSLLQYHECS